MKNPKRILLLIIVFFAFRSAIVAENCNESLSFYQNQGYTVNAVKIQAPLRGIFGTFRKSLSGYLSDPDLSQQAGLPFRESSADTVGNQIKEKIKADNRIAFVPVRVQIFTYSLQNCDSQKKELDLVYKFYVFQPAYYFPRTFEFGRKEPVTGDQPPGDKDSSVKKIEIQPYFGYDYSRRFYAGTKFGVEFDSPVVKSLSVEVTGSTSSKEIKAQVSGDRNTNTRSVRFQKWELNYSYSDIPTESARLLKGKAAGQYYASTRAFTDRELIVRFGGRFEAGNFRSSLPVAGLPAEIVQGGQVISGKGFGGVSFIAGKHRFKASYGIQLSSIEKNKKIDYAKQIFDSGADFDFGMVDAEVGFGAGTTHIFSKMPAADRYFGGNREENFLESEDWLIRANPLIRSFAPNKFASATGTNQYGGDGFVALNFTLSARIWRKPLIERNLWEDPNNPGEFRREIKAAEERGFSTGEEILKNEYLRRMPEFKDFPQLVENLRSEITEVRNLVGQIPVANRTDPIKTVIEEFTDPAGVKALQISENTIAALKSKYAEGGSIADKIEALVVDPGVEDEVSLVQDIIDRVNIIGGELAAQGTVDLAGRFKNRSTRLDELSKEMLKIYNLIVSSPQAAAAEEKAKRDLILPRQIFRFFIKDSDWISISPVFVFDAVRLRQRESTSTPWRVGTGGGIKFRFVFIDLTAGYVWNVNRRAGERRGSILVKFDIADIFK